MRRARSLPLNGFIDREASLNGAPQVVVVDIEVASKRLQREGNAVPQNLRHMSAVAALDKVVCPPTVCRLVVSARIDAVKREARRTWAQVCEEGLKVVTPLFAHGDSQGAVEWVTGVTWVIASRLRVLPGVVFLRLRSAVCSSACARHLSAKAAAALRLTVIQSLGRDFDRFPAVAETDPARARSLSSGRPTLYCDQSPKSLPDRSFDHGRNVPWFSHALQWLVHLNEAMAEAA
jgi:hypothetical protein